MVSMKDIAEHLGISRCTVSHVLNNNLDKFNYRPETVDRVRKAAKELGYVMNTVARSLKTNRTGTIAVAVADITNAFYTQVIRELEDACFENDTALIICASGENQKKEEDILTMLNSRQIDGLVISPVSYEESLQGKYPFPIVQFDRRTKNTDYPFVGINNAGAAQQGTEHMFNKGCSRPLFIGTNKDDFSVRERLSGFTKASKGDSPEPLMDVLTAEEAYEKLSTYIKEAKGEFDSVFTSTHQLTMGIAQALIDTGTDIKMIMGFEQFIGSSLLPWDVRGIVQPIGSMARRSFEMIENEIKGNPGELECIFNIKLCTCE